MSNSELKDALMEQCEVIYDGIRYTLNQIVYGVKNGKIKITVGLMDRNQNAIVYAEPEKVKRV